MYRKCDTTMYIHIFLNSLHGQKANPKVVKLIVEANFNRIYYTVPLTDHNGQKKKNEI